MKQSLPIAQLTVICFILGVLVVVQMRTTSRAASAATTSDDQARVLTTLLDSNTGLRNEITDLEQQVASLSPANQAQSNATLVSELGRLMVVNGDAPASGPGVQVQVSAVINPLDMQDLINELRNAGAEAMAINGQRIIVSSVVARQGSDLVLGDQVLTPPYVLSAIGQPDTMETALLRRGGLVGLLEYAYSGLQITVTQTQSVTLAANTQQPALKLARPAQ
jgi:uncharacterized protein YlxW (UPF0749 family)